MSAEAKLEEPIGELVGGDARTELASSRTSLALERTRIASDRTLMAVIRTSLSLMSFGFTIFQFFGTLAASLGSSDITRSSARNFGIALVALAIGMLVSGLFVHYDLINNMRSRRNRLYGLKLLRRAPQYRTTPTAVFAVLLLLIGLMAILGMIAHAGPFG
jgi:putative membrane protein